jgi:hypothetical protein
MNPWLSSLMTLDGALFALIALMVLVTPSPQPALVRPVDDDALGPFMDTRRLLAAMFLASGLLMLIIGRYVADPRALVLVARARIVSFLLVAAVNVAQLRGGRWKRPPLLFLLGAWIALCASYTALGAFGR